MLLAPTYPLTIFHKPDSDPYPAWGGPEGVQKARDLGATAIDIDAQACETGEFMAVHWALLSAYGWKSPYAGLHGKRIDTMTAEQACSFSFGGYKLHTLREVMEVAAPLKITLCVEVKSMGDFARMRKDAEETGCRVIVMTLPKLGDGYGRLAAAKKAGLKTLALLNSSRFADSAVPADKWQHLDYVKGGTAAQRRGKPDRVIFLGPGSKFGTSVGKSNARAVTAALKKKWPTPPTAPPVTPPMPKPEVPVNQAAAVIATAKKYIGVHEGKSGGSWNNDNPFAKSMGWANGQAWCASFVCAVFKEVGLLGLIATPSPGVDQLAVGFKKAGRYSEYPALGAVVFYGSPADLNHTGIVVAYNADTITTVEGNTNDNGSREGDGVYLKTRLRRSANVVGYGYPKYAEGLTAADPAYQRPMPSTTPVPSAPAPTAPQTTWPGGFKPTIDGIDLSHWQSGSLDFTKAKAAGVRFVYHKATEHTGYRDPLHTKRRGQVKAAGIPFGAYHFARPAKSSGTTQARFFLAVAKPVGGDLRPMLDLEDRGGLSANGLQRWVDDFVTEVKRQTGKSPILYTNYELTRDPGCFLWVARYNNANALPVTPKAWTRPTVWQFSNGVYGRPNSVPGIGACDINTLFPGFDLDRLKL